MYEMTGLRVASWRESGEQVKLDVRLKDDKNNEFLSTIFAEYVP